MVSIEEIWVEIFGQHRGKNYSTGFATRRTRMDITIEYGNTSLCTCLCNPTVIIFDSCTCTFSVLKSGAKTLILCAQFVILFSFILWNFCPR